MAQWDLVLGERYWTPSIMNGAVPLCDLGCGLMQWLVIHGDQRGFVWDDLRADRAGIAPATDDDGQPLTFTDWYVNWLQKIEAGEGRLPVRTAASSRRSNALWLLVLIVAGVAVVLAQEFFRR